MRDKPVASIRVYNFEKSLFRPVGGCWVDIVNVTEDRRMHRASGLVICYLPCCHVVSISPKGQRATAGNEPRVQEGEEIVPSMSHWKTELRKNARLVPKLGRRLLVLTWWGEYQSQPCRVQYL